MLMECLCANFPRRLVDEMETASGMGGDFDRFGDKNLGQFDFSQKAVYL